MKDVDEFLAEQRAPYAYDAPRAPRRLIVRAWPHKSGGLWLLSAFFDTNPPGSGGAVHITPPPISADWETIVLPNRIEIYPAGYYIDQIGDERLADELKRWREHLNAMTDSERVATWQSAEESARENGCTATPTPPESQNWARRL